MMRIQKEFSHGETISLIRRYRNAIPSALITVAIPAQATDRLILPATFALATPRPIPHLRLYRLHSNRRLSEHRPMDTRPDRRLLRILIITLKMVRLFSKFVKFRRVSLTAVYEGCTLVNEFGMFTGKN